MSARLVSRKPRPYASFVAVSISRVRLSGCAVRIFSDSEDVSHLTNLDHKPDAPVLSTPATRRFGTLVDGDRSKRRIRTEERACVRVSGATAKVVTSTKKTKIGLCEQVRVNWQTPLASRAFHVQPANAET